MDIGMENLYVDTGARRVKETSGRRGVEFSLVIKYNARFIKKISQLL